MSTRLPNGENKGSGGWHVDITTLPIRVRINEAAHNVKMISIGDQQNGSLLWWLLLPATSMHDEVVNLIIAKMKEIVVTDKRPRQIYVDNGSSFKNLAKQLNVSTTEQQVPIEVIHIEPGRPRAAGRIEASLEVIWNQLNDVPGYVDGRHGGTTRPNVDELLSFTELQEIIGNLITRWNSSQ
jgi:hypothetical protein